MTKVQNPIIGRAQGQSGGQVFSTAYGKNIMRSRPFSYRDANSQAQIVRRTIISTLAAALSGIKLALHSLFESLPTDMSPYSKLMQQLLKAFPAGSTIETPNTNNVLIGHGTYSPPTYEARYMSNAKVMEITWIAATLDPNIPQNQIAECLIINLTRGTAFLGKTEDIPSTGLASFELPYGSTDDDSFLVAFGFTFPALGCEFTKSVKRCISF